MKKAMKKVSGKVSAKSKSAKAKSKSAKTAKKAARSDSEGHRERLRRRILDMGGESLQEYELIEALLIYSVPRRDMKPLAKRLERLFGSVWGALRADPLELRNVEGLGESSIALMKLVAEISRRGALSDLSGRDDCFSDWETVRRYVRSVYKGAKKESFRVLYLDGRNRLLADEVVSRGTVDRATVYIREVLERVVYHRALSVILVHNHPSGDPSPSAEDVDVTHNIRDALSILDVDLHDHLIVGGRGDVVRFTELGLLPE